MQIVKTQPKQEVPLAQPAFTLPSGQEWMLIKEQASLVVKTGFLPSAIKTPEQAIAVALKGRELGVPMMQAFAHIHIIEGKPSISSELMLALIYRNVSSAIINFVQTDDKACVIHAARSSGQGASKFSFTIEDAKRAGVTGKSNWVKYPAAMLRARAISAMARAVFADAIMGCSYTPEELGAEVNEDGEVIEIPSQQSKPKEKQIQDAVPAPFINDAQEPGPGEVPVDLEDELIRVGKKYVGQAFRNIQTIELTSFNAWAVEQRRIGKLCTPDWDDFIVISSEILANRNDLGNIPF